MKTLIFIFASVLFISCGDNPVNVKSVLIYSLDSLLVNLPGAGSGETSLTQQVYSYDKIKVSFRYSSDLDTANESFISVNVDYEYWYDSTNTFTQAPQFLDKTMIIPFFAEQERWLNARVYLNNPFNRPVYLRIDSLRVYGIVYQ
ncbi:MAG TPA: hypothetical protein VGK25_01770 [Ignavibacteria bacterium]